ncbi:MAG: peptide ABC transporter substrate-binding protein [Candidatus Portnoybacteria bacterium]|nr:peptide ABC transporter substrate-binding protein [Candidatus Portnoybacteria bacterium]
MIIPTKIKNLISRLKQKLPNLSIPGGKKPTWQQWKKFFKILPSRERWIVRTLILIILISFSILLFDVYSNKTYLVPQVGGSYQEGILGQPRFINPVLSQTNDADRDLVQLIYSSLFKYDQQGNLIPDLAKEYTISEDGLNYDITLKSDILWHDGEPLTVSDIIFTIKTIQDSEYKSPLKGTWQGIEMEKIDEFTLRFKLNNTYTPFLHNLTVSILPRHLWFGITASNFSLAQYNLRPIGSGPYKFKEFIKDDNGKVELMELIRNKEFYLPGPYIDKITLKFYNTQSDLISAYQKRQIDGLSFLSTANQSKLRTDLNLNKINLPIYYAVFFNQTESKALSDKVVRNALAYATNKEEIINQVLQGQSTLVNSPLLSGWLGYDSETKIYDFTLEHAQNILEEANWKDLDNDGIREKTINDEEVKLEITLLTTDWPELEQTAQLLQEQWQKIGMKVNLEIIDTVTIQQEYIRPRQYQALLFGEVLNADPDPFAFWHSSQRKDPGLNLALYNNKKVDTLLEEARQSMDQEVRIQKYVEFQKLLIEDMPVIFLHSPPYLYPVKKEIKGINIEKLAQPSQRFSQVENWFIKTNRVWK